MSESDLLNRHAQELPSGTPTLTPDAVQRYLAMVPAWQVVDDGKTLRRTQRFEDFMAAVDFVNKVAQLAEEEQHHPDIRIYSYRFVDLDFSTHSIGGLSDNDFIMAAKANRLLPPA
jgi:4a-hydroxytetrahydrobiopterin dehydratase